jgi:hypothetical protein
MKWIAFWFFIINLILLIVGAIGFAVGNYYMLAPILLGLGFGIYYIKEMVRYGRDEN